MQIREFIPRFTVSLGIAMGLGGLLLVTSAEKTQFEEAALGKATTSVFLSDGDQSIHCRDLRDSHDCLNGFLAGTRRNAGIWLGNSMLHAVNQYKSGQATSQLLLHRAIAEDGIDLLTFSQPNANLQEHLLLFEYLASNIPINVLIVPVVFDDIREDGIRKDLEGILLDHAISETLSESEIGRDIIARHSISNIENNSDVAGVAGTVQEHSEMFLNDFMGGAFRDVVSARAVSRAAVFGSIQTKEYAAWHRPNVKKASNSCAVRT